MPRSESSSPDTATRPAAVKPRARAVKSASKDPELVRERRKLLVAAAVRVFKDKGFHETTVRDIGREADMTQGTIYNYVESKDDILYLVCDQIVSEYQDETRKALDNSSDPRQRVRSAVRAVCEVMDKHQDEILLIYQDSHLLDARSLRVIVARVEEFIGMFETILADAARELGVPLPEPHFAANVLTFLPTMLSLRRWSLKGRMKRREVIDGLVDFLIRGLGFD
ncbi:MAG: TetR/AcrR family transcriptional regulator [Pseudomonadota bacterium]